MLAMLQTLIVCGALVLALFIILLAAPSSRLRDVVLQIVGWGIAVCSVAYIGMPFDVIPDFIPLVGWLDDGGAFITAIGGAATALNVAKHKS